MLRIRTRLALLVIVALLPMVALIARQLLSERRHAREAARGRTMEVARLVASRADEYVRRIESVLGAAALQVRTSPPDIAYNDRILRALDDNLVGTIGTMNVHDLQERNIGSSFERVDRTRPFSLKGRRYYEQAIRTGGTPAAEIGIGFLSTALCHLGNAATRVGRTLHFDKKALHAVLDKAAKVEA